LAAQILISAALTTKANERTVKNWLSGKRGPRGEHLLGLIRHSNAALEIVLRLAGREQMIAGKALLDARNALADTLAKIDLWVSNGKDQTRAK
jgi:hypothetical protein